MSESCCNGRTKDNFFHRFTNISSWMETEIKKILESKKFTVIFMEVNAQLMTRMSKLSVINDIKLKYKDENETIFTINNYNSMNKLYDEKSNVKWLIDHIKELEMQALLEFGSLALSNNEEKEYNQATIKVDSCKIKKTEDLTYSLFINTSASEFIKFFIEKDLLFRWTLGGRITENGVEFENVLLNNIKSQKDSIEMEYKWKDWESWTKVKIDLLQAGNNLKITIKHDEIPLGILVNVKDHWKTRIIGFIANAFNCTIKSV